MHLNDNISTISLLCVEDDQVAREAVYATLTRKYPALVLFTAENGAEGLELFKRHKPDIVLTDICMPIMDGIEMARQIRALSPGTDIIATTAYSDTNYLLAAIKIGISRYVLKPLDLAPLFEAIDESIARIAMKRQVKAQNDFIRKLSLAVEQSVSMVLITDAGGIVEYINEKFSAVTGYAPEEVIGQSLRSVMTNASPVDTFENIWNTIVCGSEWRGEIMNRKKNGDLYCEEVSISPLAGVEGDITNFVAVMEDISKRKRMEEALRESEFFISASQRAASIGSYKTDFVAGVWESSDILDRIFGIDKGYDRSIQGWLDLVHPDDREGLSRYWVEEVVAGRHSFDREYRIVRQSDGQTRWVNGLGKVSSDANGNITSLIGTVQDITDRKRTEEELKLKSFTIDNLAEEILWITPDARIWNANEVACKKLGYTREELLSLTIADIDPLFPQEVWSSHWEELRAAGNLQFESLHKTKNGQVFPVDIIANCIIHNGMEYNCAIMRDISERKALEQALRNSEEQFRSLCDSAPLGIFRTDRNGDNNYINSRWEQITGLTAAEGLGNGWLKGIHPDDVKQLTRLWIEATATGRIYSHEHRQITPEGKTVWVHALANPIKDADGNANGYVGTVEDITELRQARQDALKAQKLDSLAVLAGGIAHDFNNILTGILGNISIAQMQVHDPEQVTIRLENAAKASIRARDLTQQLLTFSRGGEPVKKIIKLRGLLQEAVNFALHGSNVMCEFDIADDLWTIEVDEGQIVQVIHNLVLNAVQAMPEGGVITVSARNVDSLYEQKRFVMVSVKDTGVGIPEHHLHKIFDPYFTTKEQGSGLGLATSYSIVKKHGGKLRAISALGKGSTFKISIPAASQECAVKPASGTAGFHGGGRILVMDDEDSIREVAKTILEKLGYDVACAENGAEAVELYRQGKEEGRSFSVVILDLTIPGGIGGKEAVRRLLELDPEVKAIVSSGYSNDPIMANYQEYGFSAVLTKPYRPREMDEVLHEVLGVANP
jgi:two-component system, cell cycle sensor histidine kinase and response regulator CckA